MAFVERGESHEWMINEDAVVVEKDYLLLEQEFILNQQRLKPQEEKNEEEREKVDELRGTPMVVGTLEEIIDDNHAIVSSSAGSEYYVTMLSFVDKDQLEPNCSVLLHNKVLAVVGILADDGECYLLFFSHLVLRTNPPFAQRILW